MTPSDEKQEIDGRPPATVARNGNGGFPIRQLPRQAAALANKLARLVVEYGTLIGRGVTDDLAKLAVRVPADEVDAYGMDTRYRERMRPLLDFLYREYFRIEAVGLANVPAEGRLCLVANHAGVLPYDALMIGHAVEAEHPAGRVVRSLVDDVFINAPYLSRIFTRCGMVRASQANAERMLEEGRAVCLFPEGLQGIAKNYRDRYQLQRFGRGGFVRLCLRTRTPIIPVAVVGSEEIHPVIYQSGRLRSWLGNLLPPITPTFPLLGPLGLLPLPSKWIIEFGAPIDVRKEYGVRGEGDDLGINHAKEKIRARVQYMLYERLKSRHSIWAD